MPKFIITWDLGYGINSLVIEAADQKGANKAAYKSAREDFENSASYDAEPYTLERAEELGIEP